MARRNSAVGDDAAAKAALRIAKEVLGDSNPTDKFLVLAAAIIREEVKTEQQQPKRNGW